MTAAAIAQRRVEHCMGTVFSIDVRSPGVDRDAIARVVNWLHWVDATFSTYRPTSAISRLARAEITLADCPAAVHQVLQRGTQLSDETDGYFTCSVAGRLDPSGYVKGWAVERASDMLRAAGSVNHCVNGGGDVQCVGHPADGRHWSVGIADPLRAGELIGSVSGSPLAVATSGSAQRGAHIFDPVSRRWPTTFASVTVVGRHLAEVDAYATAAFAMGDAAPKWLERVGLRGLLIRPDGSLLSV